MIGTANLARLTELADNQHWRLVLVGDPHQLQAVGRGGLFAELCASGRTIELQHIHRFNQPWEAAASLMLRHGDPRALDTYEAHGRIIPGTLDEHLDTIANHWRARHADGATTAITTTANEHVDKINAHIQSVRLDHDELDPTRWATIAGGQYAHVDDVIATRRNDRRLRTSCGDTVRNRELWTVTHIGDTGDLTVTHLSGHGTVTLPAKYVCEHVRLGYAATEHGNQADTVTTSLTLATGATTCRGLYVAMTRGRDENLVLVVTDTHDITEARDVLEGVLNADRADPPAVTQRRNLAQQEPRQQPLRPRCQIPAWFDDLCADLASELVTARRELAEADARPQRRQDELADAQHRFRAAEVAAAPHRVAIHMGETELGAAQHDLRTAVQTRSTAKRSARRPARDALAVADLRVANAHAHLDAVRDAARPALIELDQATRVLQTLHHNAVYENILDDWARPAARIDALQRRQHALTEWHQRAIGAPISADRLKALAHDLHLDLRADPNLRYASLKIALQTWTADVGIELTPPTPQRAMEPRGMEIDF